jgi:hypothetical protein
MTPPERLIPRRDIPGEVRRLTGESKNPHEQTIRRWYSVGCRGVMLQVRYVGGEVYTTERWLKEFFELVTLAASRKFKPKKTELLPSRKGLAAQQRLMRRLTK